MVLMEASVMVQKSVASRARRLNVNFHLGLILVLSFAASPVGAQDPEQDQNRAAEKAFAEGARLWKEGTTASKRRTIEKYQEALALWRASGNRSREAEAITQIGAAHYGLNDFRKTIEYWEQALSLKRALEDRRDEATLLVNIGVAYTRSEEKERALDYLAQGASLARAT